jgi:hypothetical protein
MSTTADEHSSRQPMTNRRTAKDPQLSPRNRRCAGAPARTSARGLIIGDTLGTEAVDTHEGQAKPGIIWRGSARSRTPEPLLDAEVLAPLVRWVCQFVPAPGGHRHSGHQLVDDVNGAHRPVIHPRIALNLPGVRFDSQHKCHNVSTGDRRRSR